MAWRATDLAVRTFAAIAISAALLAVNFTSLALAKTPRPSVTKVSPSSGTTKGGTAVTISGTSFTSVKYVLFGKQKGTKLKTVSSHEITVDTPARGSGEVSVTVVTKAGSSKASGKAEFTYKAPVIPPVLPAPDTLAILAGLNHTVTPGPATSTPIGAQGVAVDPVTHDFYIADPTNDVVEEVTPSGTLSIIAGIPGVPGPEQPGPATSSPLEHPRGVAVAANGDVYIADTGDDTVEEVVPSATPGDPGTISVIAGNGKGYGTPTTGPATSEPIDYPSSVAVDSDGDVFIAAAYDQAILEVVPSATPGQPGTLSVVAGTPGTSGAVVPGDAATSIDLDYPYGVAVEGGYVYVADTQSQVILKFAVGGPVLIVAGQVGKLGPPTNDSPATTGTKLDYPYGVAVDGSGDVFIADLYNFRVEEVVPNASPGTLYVVAGDGSASPPTPGGPAVTSGVNYPYSVAVDSSNGNLFIADEADGLIEEVQPGASPTTGTLSVVAGSLIVGDPTPGPATHSALDGPSGVAVDSHGNVYIANQDSEEVDEVTPAGQLSVVAGNGDFAVPTPGPATSSSLEQPTGVAVDGHGDIFITDDDAHEVLEVKPSATAGQPGMLSVIAGNGSSGLPLTGSATSSPLEHPSAIAVNSAGDVFFTDGGPNNVGADTVDEVVPNSTPGQPGMLSVIAGTGEAGPPIPGPANLSTLDQPQGIAVGNNGDLYIADTDNDTIDEIVPGVDPGDPGTLSIVDGYPGDNNNPMEGPAFSSYLGQPQGVAVSANGTIYIADSGIDTIEEVTPVTQADPIRTLSIIAGHQAAGPPRPGLATDSELNEPAGVAVDSNGNVYIADFSNNDVEEVFAK